MWANGIVFCVYTETNDWTLSIGGPSQDTGRPSNVIASGHTPSPIAYDAWHTLLLTTVDVLAVSAKIDGVEVVTNEPIRNLDTGFATFGTNRWFHVEYDNVSLAAAGARWHPTDPCPAAQAGRPVYARPCTTNGLSIDSQRFDLRADYTLLHTASGLCLAAHPKEGSTVTLAPCNSTNPQQQFYNDYTRVRNTPCAFTLQANSTLKLSGVLSGEVFVSVVAPTGWNTWAYFPNTYQLRNQYVANTKLGYPMCLSTC